MGLLSSVAARLHSSTEHVIPWWQVDDFLRNSVIKQPVHHRTTHRAARSIINEGVSLLHHNDAAFGRGFYTAVRAERSYGPAQLRMAVKTEHPLSVPWRSGYLHRFFLNRVASATGTPVAAFRAISRSARLDAARGALLTAGYDSVLVRTPWRNTWVVSLDPAWAKVVV